MKNFRKTLISAFCLLLTVVIIVSCQANNSSVQSSVFDKIIASGKLKVGYISYPPSFIKDPNTGKYSGIFHEVLDKATKNIGFKVDYTEEVTWGTMVESVHSGRVDLVCTGIWPTGARAKGAEFSTPIYYSPIKAYTRVNDSRFDGNLGNADKKDIKIAAIDGEMSSIIANADYKNATLDSLPQSTDIAQLLLEVSSKKADITFVEVAVADQYLQKNPNSIKPVENVSPVRVFPNVMMVGKGSFELLSTLDTAIRELSNNGEIEKIISKYEQTKGTLLRPQLPYKSS